MQLGADFPRQALRRLHETSGGNPLFALELVRALQRSGRAIEPGQPLPVPDNLHDLVRGRVELLPEDTRAALLAVAALAHPTVGLLELNFDEASTARLLRPAIESQVIQLSGDRIRFTHPLLASAVYADTSRSSRRAMHRRLAEIVSDPEERARHLALGAEEPDEEIAAELDLGVRSAAGRGAHDVAVELAELAVKLTPEAETLARQRRTIDVGEHSFASGRFARAEELVTQLLEELAAGPQRARALVLSVRAREENLEVCAEIYERALEEARGDTALEAEIHRHLVETWVVLGDLALASEHARLATERTGNTPGVAMALADLAHIENAGIVHFAEDRSKPATAAVSGKITVKKGKATVKYSATGIACPAQVDATASLKGKGVSGKARVKIAAGKRTVITIPVRMRAGITAQATFTIVLKTNGRKTTETRKVTVSAK
jgi:hypothetical protein